MGRMTVAKKIGVLSGVILFILNFFAVIPLGIHFNGGLSSYAEIPLYLVNYNDVSAYVWGIIDIGGSTSSWWIGMGTDGRLALIFIQLMMLLACIITIISSWSKNEKAKIAYLISVIMMLLALVITILDMFLSGSYLGLGSVVPVAEIFSALGIGFYLLIICIILNFICIRSYKAEED